MNKGERRTINAAGLGFLVLGALLLSPSQAAEATHDTFAAGDVFVSLKTGEVLWHHANGDFNKVLTGTVPGHAEGMGFDASGNLYVTHWFVPPLNLTGNNVERFNPSGVSIGTFGSGYDCNPGSIDFDAAGNAYVGQADCSGDIRKFNAAGVLQASLNAEPDNRGTFWIDLADDGCTVFYTSSSTNVKRFNACGPAQLANFNTAPLPDAAFALRIIPDGGVLVAASTVIVRLDAAGNQVQTYDVVGEPDLWFGLDIVGDGTFWTTNFGSGNVYRINIATGGVVDAIFTGQAASMVKGVAVKRPPGVVVRRGRMTGGGSVFTDLDDTPSGNGVNSVRITHGFELHCDSTRKPNNLEINIHNGVKSRFHLLALTFAECTDDPTITPNPPAAPFDTYEGRGTGRYNGQPGATAEWVFTDAGEPGTMDRIRRLKITDANGNVVVNINEPGHPLTFGNHQAHK